MEVPVLADAHPASILVTALLCGQCFVHLSIIATMILCTARKWQGMARSVRARLRDMWIAPWCLLKGTEDALDSHVAARLEMQRLVHLHRCHLVVGVFSPLVVILTYLNPHWVSFWQKCIYVFVYGWWFLMKLFPTFMTSSRMVRLVIAASYLSLTLSVLPVDLSKAQLLTVNSFFLSLRFMLAMVLLDFKTTMLWNVVYMTTINFSYHVASSDCAELPTSGRFFFAHFFFYGDALGLLIYDAAP